MGSNLSERNRLLRSIDALVQRLEEVQVRPRQERGPESEAVSLELAQRLRQARAEYEAVMIRLAEREPARAGVIGLRAPTLRVVQSALGPAETLLHYFVTPERLIIFAVTRAGLRSLEVSVPLAELENRVRLARGVLSRPERGDSARAVLEELHRILIGPVERAGMLTDAQGLLIVPHGVLAYLPFAALRNAGTGRYLVESYSLQYLPNAASLPALRRERGRGPVSVRTSVFAPSPDLLPASAIEASVIERTIPGSRRLARESASERALRRALLQGDAVHVATHGIMNPENPMFSSLRVARGRAESPEDDGRLEVHEVLDISTTSPLVFLSGCETALGSARATQFDRGQDYVTLAQAFLFAGAQGVIATLWRIDDEGAAAFAERFYLSREGLSAVEAVAATQRLQMRDPRWGHPYYWAGYTIAGDGPLPATENRAPASVSP